MLDSRFKDKKGYCKLCHKLCFDSEEDADQFIATAPKELNLTYSYACPLHPSGYWHVTSSKRKWKAVSYDLALKRLGPRREQRLRDRISSLLSL